MYTGSRVRQGQPLINIVADLVRGIEHETEVDLAQGGQKETLVSEETTVDSEFLRTFEKLLEDQDNEETNIDWMEEIDQDICAQHVFNKLEAEENSLPESSGKVSEVFG